MAPGLVGVVNPSRRMRSPFCLEWKYRIILFSCVACLSDFSLCSVGALLPLPAPSPSPSPCSAWYYYSLEGIFTDGVSLRDVVCPCFGSKSPDIRSRVSPLIAVTLFFRVGVPSLPPLRCIPPPRRKRAGAPPQRAPRRSRSVPPSPRMRSYVR